MKLQIKLNGYWDLQGGGRNTLGELINSLRFSLRSAPTEENTVNYKFIEQIDSTTEYLNKLATVYSLNNSIINKYPLEFKTTLQEYCNRLIFVDQPRGHQNLLTTPLNARLKRNLDPLLRDLFPDVSFYIQAEGEQTDIFIYDDILGAEVPAVECGFGYSQILPILLALADSDNEVVCISEPESHIHPRLQAGIGSLFLDVYRKSGKQIIAETHSEHIVLRIQRLIRCGEMTPDEVSVLYVSKTPEGSTIKRLHLDEKGRFIDAWPKGFFAERDDELFGGKPA